MGIVSSTVEGQEEERGPDRAKAQTDWPKDEVLDTPEILLPKLGLRRTEWMWGREL